VEEWKHKQIIEWLRRYINFIEVEKITPKFIRLAYTWINSNSWENEYKTLENRFWYNKKFIAEKLQWYDTKKVDEILEQVKSRENKTKKEITEWVLDNILISLK
jgi:hypothetical protein